MQKEICSCVKNNCCFFFLCFCNVIWKISDTEYNLRLLQRRLLQFTFNLLMCITFFLLGGQTPLCMFLLLFFLQMQGNLGTYLTALPRGKMPFHFPRLDFDQLLCVRMIDKENYMWSGGFLIDRVSSFHVNMRQNSNSCINTLDSIVKKQVLSYLEKLCDIGYQFFKTNSSQIKKDFWVEIRKGNRNVFQKCVLYCIFQSNIKTVKCTRLSISLVEQKSNFLHIKL